MTTRFADLDGLRGLAALLVVLHHGTIVADWALYSGRVADSRFSWDLAVSGMPFFLLTAGDFAVCLFFVLSGFVLAHSFLHSSLGPVALAVKRYARLTIPIGVTSLISFAAAVATPKLALPGAEGAGRTAADLLDALRYCLVEAFYKTTVSGLTGPTYNGALWTIPIEFQGSLLLIAVFAFTKRIAPTLPRWQDLAGVMCAVLFLFTWQSRLGLFGAGAAIYWLFTAGHLRSREKRNGWAAALLLLGLLLGLFLGTMPESPQRLGLYNTLIGIVGAPPESGAMVAMQHPLARLLGWRDRIPYTLSPIHFWHSVGAILTLWSVLVAGTITRALNHGFCQWLGRISFPLYLIHSTVYLTIGFVVHGWATRHGASYGAASAIAGMVYTLASLAAADVLARSVEKSAVRWSGELGQWIDSHWRQAARTAANRLSP